MGVDADGINDDGDDDDSTAVRWVAVVSCVAAAAARLVALRGAATFLGYDDTSCTLASRTDPGTAPATTAWFCIRSTVS